MSFPAGSSIHINLEQQRKRAKDLRRAHQAGSLEAAVRIIRHLPRAKRLTPESILAAPFTLSEAQLVIAREAGFPSWPRLRQNAEAAGRDSGEALIDAALKGDGEAAAAALDRDPNAPRRSVCAAAALADREAALGLLAANPGLADLAGGRRGWKPLLYLCSSRYRRGEGDADRVAIARRLLDLGAAVTGREPGFQSTHGTMVSAENELFAIEAAAGCTASLELVRVLLEAGADLSQTTVALLQAVRGGRMEVLRYLLDALPSDVLWQVGWALHEAVVIARKDMLRVLADRAELPAEPALMEAIRSGRDAETVEILLGQPSESARSRTALHNAYRCAVRYRNVAAADLLRLRGADESSITAADRMLAACLNGDAPPRDFPRALLTDEDHQLLAWAIRSGRRQAVPLLLQAGLDPNVAGRDGETPLHEAVRFGETEMVEALIRAGAAVDQRNFDAQTALEIALQLDAGSARDRIVRNLLDAGASPAQISQRHSKTGRALLPFEDDESEDPEIRFERAADAVVNGDVSALRAMLDAAPWLAQARSPRPHRATLLHYCGANGVEEERQRTPKNAPEILKLLLDRGADANSACWLYGSGSMTLGLLLTSSYPLRAGVLREMVELLLNAGAIFDGARGTAGLSGAAALGRLDLVRGFFDGIVPAKDRIQSAFGWACEFGRTEVAAFLLDRGADVRVADGNGQTGLHRTALGGHLDTMKLLLERGAPLDARNVWGATVLPNVLWGAVHHNPNVDYTPVVETLIDAGATVEDGVLDWWNQQEVLRPATKPGIEEQLRRRRAG